MNLEWKGGGCNSPYNMRSYPVEDASREEAAVTAINLVWACGS